MPGHFSWTESTGLEEMQFKIERDESDMKKSGGREQAATTAPGLFQALKSGVLVWTHAGTAAAV